MARIRLRKNFIIAGQRFRRGEEHEIADELAYKLVVSRIADSLTGEIPPPPDEAPPKKKPGRPRKAVDEPDRETAEA